MDERAGDGGRAGDKAREHGGLARDGAIAEGLDLPGVLRALRRRADLSQRELAGLAGVDHARVGRLEAGEVADPRLRTVERLVRAAGARLAVVDLDGTEPVPEPGRHQDAGGRRLPPHLDAYPLTRWRGAYRTDVVSFLRNRRRRDEDRRDQAGERRWEMFTEIRRLGPRDLGILATLREDAAELDPAGRAAPGGPPAGEAQALRYLRDPSLRHWIAEDRRRILGHLVAYLHLRYAGPPALVVTGIGLRPEHRAGTIGPQLVAALCDEAARLGVEDIWAFADHPAVARSLRRLGFDARSGRPEVLAVW